MAITFDEYGNMTTDFLLAQRKLEEKRAQELAMTVARHIHRDARLYDAACQILMNIVKTVRDNDGTWIAIRESAINQLRKAIEER